MGGGGGARLTPKRGFEPTTIDGSWLPVTRVSSANQNKECRASSANQNVTDNVLRRKLGECLPCLAHKLKHRNHRYEGGRIANCAEPVGNVVAVKTASKLVLCVGCEIRSTEPELSLRAKNTEFTCQSFLLIVNGPHERVYVCLLGWSHMH